MTIFGTLEIGKTGLNAAQLGQSTTGHNISNVNTEGYSRQRVEQSAESNRHDGKHNGVRIDGIDRLYDVFNAEKVIEQTSLLNDWESRLKYLQNLESVFQDLEGRSVLDALTEFWNAWSSVATQPESIAERQNLVIVARQLTEKFSQLDQKLVEIKTGMTNEMVLQIDRVNELSNDVSKLNKQISRVEGLQGNANDLKDQRDEAIRQISELVDINWFFNKQNQIDVQLSAGVPLVRGTSSYNLKLFTDMLEPASPVLGYELVGGKLINVTDQLRGGKIKGIITTRDQIIEGQRDSLKELAKHLSKNINTLHAPGTGLGQTLTSVTSQIEIDPREIDEPISFLTDGQLSIKLIPNASLSDPMNITIDVQAGIDSLQSIAMKLNQAAEDINPISNQIENIDQNVNQLQQSYSADNSINSQVDEDGRLVINAGQGYSFIFNEDSSGLLGKVGINPFFVFNGDFYDFRIRDDLLDNPTNVAAGYDQNPGDNRIALAIHDLQFAKIMNNKNATLDEYYREMYTTVGAETKTAIKNKTNHQNIYDQYLELRNNITGVNIDEEMANMIKYQKAYDASAKYITTIDKMTESLLNM